MFTHWKIFTNRPILLLKRVKSATVSPFTTTHACVHLVHAVFINYSTRERLHNDYPPPRSPPSRPNPRESRCLCFWSRCRWGCHPRTRQSPWRSRWRRWRSWRVCGAAVRWPPRSDPPQWSPVNPRQTWWSPAALGTLSPVYRRRESLRAHWTVPPSVLDHHKSLWMKSFLRVLLLLLHLSLICRKPETNGRTPPLLATSASVWASRGQEDTSVRGATRCGSEWGGGPEINPACQRLYFQ